MEQEIAQAILSEIVQSVIENHSIKETDSVRVSQKYVEAVSSVFANDNEEFKDTKEGRGQCSNMDYVVQSETESSSRVDQISDHILLDSSVIKINKSTTDATLISSRNSIEEVRITEEKEHAASLDSSLSNTESVRHTFEYIGRAYDPEAIEPYSPEYGDEERKINQSGNSKEELELPDISAREGASKEYQPSVATSIELSVRVLNSNSYESATSSDSDIHDVESSLHKSNLGFKSSSRRISKKSFHRSSFRNKSRYLQAGIEAPSTSKDIVPSVIVIDNNSDENSILLDTYFPDTKSSLYKSKGDYRVSNTNSSIRRYYNEEEIQIAQLSESPGNYRRRLRYLQENIETPSTSTNIEPSVIVINEYSNDSSVSTHSTCEMQRRTERNFAFLSDSDCSDVETSKHTLGYQNRAYEPSEEIELRSHAQLASSFATNALDSDLRSDDFNNSYIWSTTGFLKVAQVICCITMSISIGLCRFSNRCIQVYCVVGACFSFFLLLVYSYRIDFLFWKAYKIRLLLLEFVYLIIYTICETIFAIIKFEYDQEANERERTAIMVLMISTLIAGSTHCYDAIECFSYMEQAGKDNPEEKKLIFSFLPTCSQSSRAEICDVFHTCIL